MMATEEIKTTTHTPIYDALAEEFGAPDTYARKATEEYLKEHGAGKSLDDDTPKPKPPAGKEGVAYTTKSVKK